MFTGLIEEIGRFESLTPRGSGTEIRVTAPGMAPHLTIGESVAFDGCCLTVETFDDNGFTVFAAPETLDKTSLGERRPGDCVNLERALALGARLGGHLVAGHVDGVGRFREARDLGGAWEVWIEAPAPLLNLSIPKGSIAVDGVSLTIVEITETAFSLSIIPETWANTTISQRKPGDAVNLETDMIGKYVLKFLKNGDLVQNAQTRLEDVWSRFKS